MPENKWKGSRPSIGALNKGSKKRSQSADAATVSAKQEAARKMRSDSDKFRAAAGKKPLKPGAEYQAARRKARRELLNKKT